MPPTFPALPGWVHLRDGRLAPFDPGRISQSLFTATAALGQPNAFLARELTDSVLHFLAEDHDGSIPTTAQIAELIVKVLRELGQVPLARVYAQIQAQPPEEIPRPVLELPVETSTSPQSLTRQCLLAYSLSEVFSRDLAAAQADGLITLLGLEHPLELESCVLGAVPAEASSGTAIRTGLDLLQRLRDARGVAADITAIDSPEYLVGEPTAPETVRTSWPGELALGLQLTGMRALIHLNCARPPSWAETPTLGPLFQSHGSPDRISCRPSSEELLDQLLFEEPLRHRSAIDWHLSAGDFPDPAPRSHRLLRVARAALAKNRIFFIFDRPRRNLILGPGLDRSTPAVLLTVAVQLPQVADLPGVGRDADLFLRKLGSVARWCLSAAQQKRVFLRRRASSGDNPTPTLHRGFLLDRARLVVIPVGLEATVRRLTGRGLCDDWVGLDLAQRILQRLREVLHQEGASTNLSVCLGGASPLLPTGPLQPGWSWTSADGHLAPDVTPWDANAPPLAQLRAAGALHGSSDQGTATLLLPPERTLEVEELAELLQFAWKQTEIRRLVVVRGEARQPSLPGME